MLTSLTRELRSREILQVSWGPLAEGWQIWGLPVLQGERWVVLTWCSSSRALFSFWSFAMESSLSERSPVRVRTLWSRAWKPGCERDRSLSLGTPLVGGEEALVLREGPWFGCTLESPGSLRNTILMSHPSHPSQNLGGKGSSENHQFRPLLLKTWSLDVSCGIDQECVGTWILGPCQTCQPRICILSGSWWFGYTSELERHGFGHVYLSLLMDPIHLQGTKWVLGPRANKVVSGARGSPWSYLEGHQLLVWAAISGSTLLIGLPVLGREEEWTWCCRTFCEGPGMLRLSGKQANADAWNPRLEENQWGLSLDSTMIVWIALSPFRQLL